MGIKNREIAGSKIGIGTAQHFGVVVGIDDGDCLTATITDDGTVSSIVEPVGVSNLSGCEVGGHNSLFER